MTVNQLCISCRTAASSLAVADTGLKNSILLSASSLLVQNYDFIISENKKDIEAAAHLRPALIDRLTLNKTRIDGIAGGLRQVASLPDPCGSGEVFCRPNGLQIKRVHVPLGVIGIIYEARPNVTSDAAALCIKSGNGVVLRGGSDAIRSNKAIVTLLRQAISDNGLSPDIVCMIEDTSRDSADQLMQAKGLIDLLIPRGGKGLIRSVVEKATVPVIETGAGNCHVYVEESADLDMALSILINAKTSRPSVCNAAEHLLLDKTIADVFLPKVQSALPEVILRGDKRTLDSIDIEQATDLDFFTEYDDYILSIKVVDGIDEAIEHINTHSTHHSEAIITNDLLKAGLFTDRIDSAAVYVNASTRFTDGEEFGFGAEIGISTQKLHARGPMGLNELTTVKYIINGNGQIR